MSFSPSTRHPDIYFGQSLLRSKDAIHIIRAHRRGPKSSSTQ
jgi:hypothetical protein